MTLTPQDIQGKEFREKFRGYNQDDVDEFLDEVAEEFARVYQENQRMRTQLASAQQELRRAGERRVPDAPPPPPRSPEVVAGRAEAREEMKRALVAAQRAAETAVEEARHRAAEIVARAEQKAAEIDKLTDARAKELESSAGQAAAQARIETLRRHEREVATKLRSLVADLNARLRSLEPETTPGAPSHSASPPAPPPPDAVRSPVVERMARELGEAADPAGREGSGAGLAEDAGPEAPSSPAGGQAV